LIEEKNALSITPERGKCHPQYKKVRA